MAQRTNAENTDTKVKPLTALVPVKDFADDHDGHYDLDGVSFAAGEVVVATDKNGESPDELLDGSRELQVEEKSSARETGRTTEL